MRNKRRYIALTIENYGILNGQEIYNSILDSILRLFGEYGASKANLSLIEYKPELKQIIFQCNRNALNMVKSSIATVTEIDTCKVILSTVFVSGTIKALKKKLSNKINELPRAHTLPKYKSS